MGANTIAGFLNELLDDQSYRGYRANREAMPQMTPESWRKVYGPDVERYERRYQDEINAYANEKREPQHAFGVSACGRSDREGR